MLWNSKGTQNGISNNYSFVAIRYFDNKCITFVHFFMAY
jgi:hypothetical protein